MCKELPPIRQRKTILVNYLRFYMSGVLFTLVLWFRVSQGCNQTGLDWLDMFISGVWGPCPSSWVMGRIQFCCRS